MRGTVGAAALLGAALLGAVLLGAALLAGVRGRDAAGREEVVETPPAAEPAAVVDSVIPIEVALARFRAGVEEPTGLRSEIGTRDALVDSLVKALAASDSLGVEALTVNLAEYAWLYYPSSVISRPPYELPPALAWFQLQQGNRTGALRALRELGGRRVDYRGYECAPDPTKEGENRVWIGCSAMIGRDGNPPAPIQLFSSILERDGRFAILSFANEF